MGDFLENAKLKFKLRNSGEKDCLQLIEKNPKLIKMIPRKYRNDRVFLIEAVRRNPKVFPNITSSLRKDKEFILELLEPNIKSEFIDQTMRNDADWARASYRDSEIYRYLSEELKADKDIALKTITPPSKENYRNIETGINYANYIQDMPKELREDRKFIMKVVQANPMALEYLPEYADAEWIVTLGVEKDRRALQYASPRLQEIFNKRWKEQQKGDIEPEKTNQLGEEKIDETIGGERWALLRRIRNKSRQVAELDSQIKEEQNQGQNRE